MAEIYVGLGLGGRLTTCLEFGRGVGQSGFIVELDTVHPEDPRALQNIGSFCEECAGRFSRVEQDEANPFKSVVHTDMRELRAAMKRAAKRLRLLARELEQAEIGRD